MDKFINKVIQGDCLIKLKELEDNSVDSIVTDPPYHLVSIVKRFGKEGSAPAQFGTDGAFSRASKGFMGKTWDGLGEDGIGIANNPLMWAECLRVLKPGGHLLAFSGTRTYHRMACAIEDAGFEVRDMIEYCYGSGFPKSLNVWKHLKKNCTCGNMEVYEKRIQLQQTLGEAETEYEMRLMQESDLPQTINTKNEQGEVLQSGVSEQSTPIKGMQLSDKIRKGQPSLEGRDNAQEDTRKLSGNDLCEMSEGISTNGEERRIHNATQTGDGSTPEQTTDENGSGASQRPQPEKQQYREPCAFCKQYGTQVIRTLGIGTALKPAHEPICMARKPLSEKTVAENCLKWGTGGINIDESRVDYQSEADKASATPQGKCTSNTSAGSAPDVDMSEVDYNGERYWYKNEYKWLVDKWLNDEDYVWSELKENLETYDWCKVPEIDSGDRVLFDSGEGVCIRLYESKRKEFVRPEQLGRFPANLIHDNSEEVRECFPDSKSGNGKANIYKKYGGHWGKGKQIRNEDYGDSGSASRFFKSIIYQAKASKSERNKGCEGLEEKEEVYPGINTFDESGNRLRADGSVIPPLKSKNNHPTVKPIALMEYLIKMVTPKGGVVLDPFAGSGSTLIAAKQEGFNYIGIERESDYVKIAEARLKAVNNSLNI